MCVLMSVKGVGGGVGVGWFLKCYTEKMKLTEKARETQ